MNDVLCSNTIGDKIKMTLKDLEIGESARIKTVGGNGALRQHFLDMGVIPGAETTVVKFAPMGDPMELMIHGYELALRLDDAEKIEISSDGEQNGDGPDISSGKKIQKAETHGADFAHPQFKVIPDLERGGNIM